MPRECLAAFAAALLLHLLLVSTGVETSRALAAPSASPGATVSTTPPDTLVASTRPDTPLILSLPTTINDRPVSRYEIVNGPALCGVAGHSFTWIPRRAADSSHHASLQAVHPDAPSDTVVVRMDVQS